MNARVPQLYVEASGAGPPLVLLHGFAMHGGLFAPLLPALTPHFRVHVVDLPGHGRSPSIDNSDMSALAAAIDDATTTLALVAERAFLATTGAGCTGIVGALARVSEVTVELTGFLARADGRLVRGIRSAPLADAAVLGRDLAMELREERT